MAIKAVIRLDGTQAIKTIKTLNKGLEKTGDTGKKSIGGITSAMKVFQGVIGAQIALKSLTALSGAFTDAGRNALEFGQTVQEINSIAPRTAEATLILKNELIALSNEFGGSAQNNARAFYNIVSAGVKGTTKQLQTLEIANKAAVAGLVDIDTSARVLVASVNSYATSNLTAAQASDILFNTVKEGITTFGELADNIGTVAPLASAAGVKFSELSGTLAFLTKSGIRTDKAATQLRATITGVIKPSEGAKKAAKDMGIEFSTSAIKSKGFGAFLGDIIKKTGGSEKALAKLFPNVRALSGVISIAKGDFNDFNRILESTANASGSTADALKTIQESAAFQQKKLARQLENFGTSVLTNFEEPIADALKQINEFIGDKGLLLVADAINFIIDSFQNFSTAASTIQQVWNFLQSGANDAALAYNDFLLTMVDTQIAINNVKGASDEEIFALQERRFAIKQVQKELKKAKLRGMDAIMSILSEYREQVTAH